MEFPLFISFPWLQDCLLRWLRCGRRCPLCRLDLHRAFLETAAPAVSPDPGEVSG